ncbi:DegT/DnrJ/EryC1/StrS family aminotransferase [Actinoplanes sp. NPDC051851]|uniref:DegT/DnrJ/EryC1/StrS family aminotransferase n=1 Tax=Actinoplanes sp. NPDC051851 TaxID=3154753 RepID=UPI003412A87A
MSTVLHYYRGRVALHAVLEGLGVGAGDPVVVQAYTCAAVVEPLLRLGARPVFVDIGRESLTIDPALVPADARAIVVQHTFGNLARLPDTGVPVIEDCAHLGPDAPPTTGVASFNSFEWGKPVVAGVGGSATVQDPALAAEMQIRYERYTAPPARRELIMTAEYLAFRVAAETGALWRLRALYRRLAGAGVIVGSYDDDPVHSPEYRWRMSRTVRRRLPARAASGRRGLRTRRHVVNAYQKGLELIGVEDLSPRRAEAVPLRLPVVVERKAEVLTAAAAAGVELGDWFVSPVHPLRGAALTEIGYEKGSCPNAEWAARHIVTFPVRADVSPAMVERGLRLLAAQKAAGHV